MLPPMPAVGRENSVNRSPFRPGLYGKTVSFSREGWKALRQEPSCSLSVVKSSYAWDRWALVNSRFYRIGPVLRSCHSFVRSFVVVPPLVLMDLTKKLKLRFRVGDLDLPERKKRYTSSWEEDLDAHMCPCGTTVESRTHIVGYYEIYKERNGMC